MRTPEEIAQDLEAVRTEQAALEVRYNALRKELLDLCVPRRQFQVGAWAIQVVKFTKWKPSIVRLLADRQFYEALRPVNEVVDRLSSDGALTFADLSPHLERKGLSYRVVAAQENPDLRFAGAYGKSVRSQYAAVTEEKEQTPFDEDVPRHLVEQILAAQESTS